MRAVKSHSVGGELVDMRGDSDIGPIAAEFGAKIIDCDEEDVGALGCVCE